MPIIRCLVKFQSILMIYLFTSFILGCGKTKRTKVDILTTFEITPTTIIAGGYVVELGKSEITSRGICYGLLPYPTLDGNFEESQTILESRLFDCSLTNLISDTTYYLSAFAQDKSGKIFYSQELTVETKYTIGCPGPAGGIVFYLDGTGGGLELALSDQGTGITWGCQGVSIDAAQNTGVGYGSANTTAIIAGCVDINCAAKICDDFAFNGYTDWYLPSLDELSLIYLNIFREGKGNLSSGFYWTSTEQNEQRAWQYLLGTGSKVDNYKSFDGGNVRAIRAF